MTAIPDLHAAATGLPWPVRIEPCPRRLRVVFAGEVVADSEAAWYLFEQGHLPVYYFPRGDVRFDLLEPTDHHTTCPRKGARLVLVDRRRRPAGRERRVGLPGGDRRLPGHHRSRRLLLERRRRLVRGGRRGVRPRPRPVQADRHVALVAPRPGLRRRRARRRVAPAGPAVRDRPADALLPPGRSTCAATCSCRPRPPRAARTRATASYWSVRTAERTCTRTSCGSTPHPIPEIPKIEQHLCFFNERVDLVVDGVALERPASPWSVAPRPNGDKEARS